MNENLKREYEGSIYQTFGVSFDEFVKLKTKDCMPCGRHPNECPCGDGACPDYTP